ncbi:MAG: DUF3078 domain-containing protein [Cyclobacteriaceae bacterium]|nr:DUF3078 domain-containing protein [Cyclobacteriaceae bacterium]
MRVLIFIILFPLPELLFAQGGMIDSIRTKYDTISYWVKGGNAAITFQQVGLKNWNAGGNELLAFNLNFRGFANKEMERYIWFNQFDVAYSLSRQGDQKKIRANKDNWKITSRLNRKLENNWSLVVGLMIQSQFSALYKVSIDKDTDKEITTLTSNFLSPGYLWPSFGFMYAVEDKFNVSFLPLTGKFTIMLDDSLSNAGAFGVKKGQHFRPENGFGIDANMKIDVMKNISLESEFYTFTRYDDIFMTDVRWDFLLRFKVNKFFSGFFLSNLIYDKDVVDKIQFRYSINMGLAYDFNF